MDSYEKKYKEALEQAKKELAQSGPDSESARQIKRFFPELTESEDERIRKMCITAVNIAASTDGGLLHHEASGCLAWLEEQKDKNCLACDQHLKGYLAGRKVTEEEKQKEQEHPNGCFTCDEYKKGYEAGRLNGLTAGYNKAMKEQKPAEWKPTEEQFNYLAKAIMTLGEEGDCKTAGVLSEIRKGLKCSFPDWKVSPDYPEEGCNVSLNGEVKKIQEWSEEDERMIHDASIWIAEYAGVLVSSNENKADMLWELSRKLVCSLNNSINYKP